MLDIVAIFLPPVSVLLAGRPASAVLNLILTLLLWLPGVVRAFIVIGDVKAEKRTSRVIAAMGKR